MRPSHRRSRFLAGAVGSAVAGCLVVAGCGGPDADGQGAGGAASVAAPDHNPYAGREGYADPDSPAARAAADRRWDDLEARRVLDRLARTPSGIWLTPEEHPPGEVGSFVGRVVAAAGAADQVPTFVVYGIPDRDCSGGFSRGGLPAQEYGSWVQEVADAAGAGSDVVAVVEPDALAAAVECDRREQRVRLVADATRRLAAAGVTTYVDGGHSHWVDPVVLAGLLRRAGVEDVRGFATNVANYQSDADERAYGEELSGLLDGAHYVVDTGRNGNGSTGTWCNPAGRAFGSDPGAAPRGDAPHLDAYLWVKPPGESDGECGGGPPAGRLWPRRALEMAASSGW